MSTEKVSAEIEQAVAAGEEKSSEQKKLADQLKE